LDKILDKVNFPHDIKGFTNVELDQLAHEIRMFLIEKVSLTGGHLASNLGVVELTLALHKIFDTPIDKIIWDVGHQSYVHKIITGRKDRFSTLRKLGGLSGFPKTSESCYDSFNTGHSSTSISAALGFARARDIKHDNYSVIAVIGDGSLTGGMAFEALNDAGCGTTNIIVILNDNNMSIAKNVGGLSNYLSRITSANLYFNLKKDLRKFLNRIPGIGHPIFKTLKRIRDTVKYIFIPGTFFEEIGFKYVGIVDGHNIKELQRIFEHVKTIEGPVLVHVRTTKGKGYAFAEENPDIFHGIAPFEVETGELKSNKKITFSDKFGQEIERLAELDNRIVAITAAMAQGTGFKDFAVKFPDRFFDVGIAEQHAVTFSAGLAINGMIPVFSVYSSFLQRGYDQILHDVILQKLHIIFAIDRAGIVGEDGETHQGIYDLSYLSHMPFLTIMAPVNYSELKAMLNHAIYNCDGPVAIRYPRGRENENMPECLEVSQGKGALIKEGENITIAAVGRMVSLACKVSDILEKNGFTCDVINARFIKPLDHKLILNSCSKTGMIVTIEDNTVKGGFGSAVLELVNENRVNAFVKMYGFPDKIITHGKVEEIFDMYGMTPEKISDDIIKMLNRDWI
jgi:1-deoxy-D-xylulose-5-phosphate synthase